MRKTFTVFVLFAFMCSLVLVLPAGAATNGKIAFWSLYDGEIYVMNPDGSDQIRLTDNAWIDAHPAWSPDGTKIAFASERDGNREIYVMDANGDNPIRLTDHPEIDDGPAWSPDGTKIAFWSRRDGDDNIYVMDVNGDNLAQLTYGGAYDANPTWSPDSTRIAFETGRDGNDDIYVMNADGNNQVPLTQNYPVGDLDPAWSPDGTKIAFASNREGPYSGFLNIFVMDADGTNPTQLTTTAYPYFAHQPAWSPDGMKIAFSLYAEIYVMDADGSNPTQPLAVGFDPTWGIAVETPEQEINDLKTAVEGLNLINGRGYTAKLDAALNDLARGDSNGAIVKLNDFINLAKAQRGKKLMNADALIAQAQEIIDNM